jgi:hypothetical protein
MVATIYVATLLLLIATSGTAFAWDAILTCRMQEETGFTIDKDRPTHSRSPWSPNENEIVFAGLDGATPSMKGNTGESRLTVIRREAEAVWLMERPLIGGVNVYTLFRDTKRVVLSKQYRADALGGVVLALVSIGQCR